MFYPWPAYLEAIHNVFDANVVVAMRLSRLASGGALAQREARRMVAEKSFAVIEANAIAMARLMTGAGIAGAAKSASDVYRKKVKLNRRRLVR